MLGSLLTGVGSVIGGLLGGEERQKSRGKSKTKSRSTTTNQTHLGKMVRVAERNGFNPLTLLRAGGLAAFTDTTTTGKSKTKSKSHGSSSSSAPLAAGIAGGIGAIGNALGEYASQEAATAANAWQMPDNVPIPATNPRAEYDLLQAQLGGVDYGTLGTQPRVPVSSTYSAKPALAAGSSGDGAPVMPTFETPSATNPFREGSGILIDPKVPDPGTRYQSELGQTLNDLYVGYHDFKKNQEQPGSAWDVFINHDVPAFEKRARELYDSAVSSNIWDPPAISMFNRPVVAVQPVPALKNNGLPSGGQWGGW